MAIFGMSMNRKKRSCWTFIFSHSYYSLFLPFSMYDVRRKIMKFALNGSPLSWFIFVSNCKMYKRNVIISNMESCNENQLQSECKSEKKPRKMQCTIFFVIAAPGYNSMRKMKIINLIVSTNWIFLKLFWWWRFSFFPFKLFKWIHLAVTYSNFLPFWTNTGKCEYIWTS